VSAELPAGSLIAGGERRMKSRLPAPARLPKSARIRKRREYLRVQQDGVRLKLPHFVFVLGIRDASGPSARLGITASRKVGGAVVRNRIKRLVREAFRQNPDLFPGDVDVVVIARQIPESMCLSEVIAEWRAAEKPLRARVEQARRARAADSKRISAASDGPAPGGRC